MIVSMAPNASGDPDTDTYTSTRRPNRFFDWIRDLRIVREPGWIGGVCAGVGARLGIDAIIVRGILVVLAIFGVPVLLAYAAAWLLLPDRRDEIHLERLLRGHPEPALIGIGVLVLLSMLPNGVPVWFFGFNNPLYYYMFPGSFGGFVLRAFWTVFVIALIVAFVIWMSHRARRHDEWMRKSRPASAAQSASAGTAPAQEADPAAAAATTVTEPATAPDSTPDPEGPESSIPPSGRPAPPSEPPPAPPADAGAEELAAWREQRAVWKREHDAWKQQQAESERQLLRAQAEEQRRQRQEQHAQWRRERAERRKRTRSHPLFSLAAIGLALLLGAAVMLALGGGRWSSTAAITGLAITLGVLGLAIVVNGFLGRRSGGSSGLAVLTAIALIAITALSGVGGLLGPRETVTWSPTASINGVNFGYSQQRFVANGDVTLDLRGYFTGLSEDTDAGAIRLTVGTGSVRVILPADEYGYVSTHSALGTVRFLDDQPGVDDGPFANTYRMYGPDGVLPNLLEVETPPTRDYYVSVMIGIGDITIEHPTPAKESTP